MAIPEGRNAAGFTLSCQRITGSGDNFARIGTNQQVCALGDGNGALRVIAQRKAGDTESRGLFLDATRIGEDELGFAQETEKIEVPDGRNCWATGKKWSKESIITLPTMKMLLRGRPSFIGGSMAPSSVTQR